MDERGRADALLEEAGVGKVKLVEDYKDCVSSGKVPDKSFTIMAYNDFSATDLIRQFGLRWTKTGT